MEGQRKGRGYQVPTPPRQEVIPLTGSPIVRARPGREFRRARDSKLDRAYAVSDHGVAFRQSDFPSTDPIRLRSQSHDKGVVFLPWFNCSNGDR